MPISNLVSQHQKFYREGITDEGEELFVELTSCQKIENISIKHSIIIKE